MFKPAALAKWLCSLLTLSVLAGCGFQLRGEHPVPFRTVAVQPAGYSLLSEELKRALREQGHAQIVTVTDKPDAVVILISDEMERNIISINTAGRVREIELVRRFKYNIQQAGQEPQLVPYQILLRRDMTYDDVQVLSKAQEESFLYRDMQQDIIRQILRRMQAMQVSH